MNTIEEKEKYEKLWENILLDAMNGKFDRPKICEVMKKLNDLDKIIYKIWSK